MYLGFFVVGVGDKPDHPGVPGVVTAFSAVGVSEVSWFPGVSRSSGADTNVYVQFLRVY